MAMLATRLNVQVLPIALTLGFFLATTPSRASAQDAPRAVLLRPVLRGDDVDGVGHALERVLRTRLGEHAVVRLGPTPALDLADLQLAVGCVAESRECLTLVVTQLEVDVLLMFGVERAGSELVVTLAKFDRGGGDLEATTRRVPGPNADAEALDEMDSLVRQAFGLGPAVAGSEDAAADRSEADDAGIPGSDRTTERSVTAASDGSELVAPLLLLGLGAAGLGTGIGLGVASEGSAAAYATYPVNTPADVDAATAIFQRAEREAIAADVLMPLGGAMIAAGAIVWIVQESLRANSSDSAPAVDLQVGPSSVAVTLTGRFDGGAR